jgi:hypothetical protein
LAVGSLGKFAGDGESFLALHCCNAVSGQIEKSDIMRRFAQIGQEIQMVSGTTIKPAQIKQWKQRRGVRHIKTPGGSDPGRQSEWQRDPANILMLVSLTKSLP